MKADRAKLPSAPAEEQDAAGATIELQVASTEVVDQPPNPQLTALPWWRRTTKLEEYDIEPPSTKRKVLDIALPIAIFYSMAMAIGFPLNAYYFGDLTGGRSGTCGCSNEGKRVNVAAVIATCASAVIIPLCLRFFLKWSCHRRCQSSTSLCCCLCLRPGMKRTVYGSTLA